MNTRAHAAQEQNSQSASIDRAQNQSQHLSTFQIENNRPESIAQQRQQEITSVGNQATQLRDVRFKHATQASPFIQKKENTFATQTKQNGSNALVQRESFSKHETNRDIEPNAVGEENNGIRVVDPADARPDDVPFMQEYREAMHNLHDVILVAERELNAAQEDHEAETFLDEPRETMVAYQGKGKVLAKEFKAEMRDLTSRAKVSAIKKSYTIQMTKLKTEIEQFAASLKKKHIPDIDSEDVATDGVDLWRQRWLKVKDSVDTALTAEWPKRKGAIEKAAVSNFNKETDGKKIEESAVKAENWNLSYGGSLAKGYKGPPKQNTRFLSSYFDVDANMDAPLVADYLILKGKTIDRGQLEPTKETKIPDMDSDIHTAIVDELQYGLDLPEESVDSILSEEFETRVNQPANPRKTSEGEIERSAKEQEVRDALTMVRHKYPDRMFAILHLTSGMEKYLNPGRNALSTDVILPTQFIAKLQKSIDKYGSDRKLSKSDERTLRIKRKQ